MEIKMCKRGIIIVFGLLFGLACTMNAQQIVIQVVDGKTNKPVSKAKLFISFPAETERQSLQLFTNENGETSVSLDGDASFEIHPIALVTCGEQTPGAKPPIFSVNQIMGSGVLTRNDCGHSSREPIRGRLVYFVRKAGWWELFKN